MNRYLQDANDLNLRMVADILQNTEESVATVGIDDTTKTAGRKLYYVKTDPLLFVDQLSRERHLQLVFRKR